MAADAIGAVAGEFAVAKFAHARRGGYCGVGFVDVRLRIYAVTAQLCHAGW